jgi:PDZ domain
MKYILLSTFVSAGCGWLMSDSAFAGDPANVDVQVVVGRQEDGSGAGTAHVRRQVFFIADADGKQGSAAIAGPGAMVIASDGTGDREPVSLVVRAEVSGDQFDKNSGWLGVTLGYVSDSTQEDLGDTKGLTVLNVARGSAAESAGFEQGDIITEVDDQAIGADLPKLVELISGSSPGERMKFTVIRGGERMNLVATLGSRDAAVSNLEWIFEQPAPDAQMFEAWSTSGKLLFQGDGGEWVFKDFADMDELPEALRDMVRGPLGMTVNMSVRVDDDRATVSTTMVRDGVTIEVTRDSDGPITVTRTDEDGTVDANVYEDMDALADADAEAAEVLAKASAEHVMVGVPQTFAFDGAAMREAIERQVQSSQGSMNDAMDHVRTAMLHYEDAEGDAGDRHHAVMRRIFGSRVSRSIHANADGTIDVTVRKGENELVTHYADAADLEARDPGAYATFVELSNIDDE